MWPEKGCASLEAPRFQGRERGSNALFESLWYENVSPDNGRRAPQGKAGGPSLSGGLIDARWADDDDDGEMTDLTLRGDERKGEMKMGEPRKTNASSAPTSMEWLGARRPSVAGIF